MNPIDKINTVAGLNDRIPLGFPAASLVVERLSDGIPLGFPAAGLIVQKFPPSCRH